MSHVDEGTLHAYLDGELPSSERGAVAAHLAQCGHCRALLAEEQALLERASALLGAAQPAQRPVPAFEQIRRTPPRSPWHVGMPVAWAASIVLALGLGYYLRDAGTATAPAVLEQHSVAAAPPATETADAPGVALLDSAPAAPAPTRQRASVRPPSELASANRAALVDSAARRESTMRGYLTEPRVSLRGATPGVAAARVDSFLGRDTATRLEEIALSSAVTVQSDAAQGRVAAPSVRRAERQSVRELVSTSWPVISRGTAASLLGDKPVGVPGLATRGIRRSPGSDSTVVVEQALDSSTVIQIFQRPARDAFYVDGAPVSAGVERARADRILARYVGRLRVEISGPVSTDSLNKLLDQVEPLP